MELSVQELSSRLAITEANLSEKISELEYDLEERGWEKLFGQSDVEFSRDALRRICRESRLFMMKNPIVKRAVDLENSYVFGQGVTIEADNEETVDPIVQEFLSDELNRGEIATPRAMAAQNVDLKIDGNLFLCFFVNADGDLRVRAIPFDEIQDVISNPEDAKEPWFYLRRRIPRASLLGDTPQPVIDTLHPDWQYTPQDRPPSYKGTPIDWEHPVYHVAVNRLSGQRFGLSEIYAAQDWARAYNEFLANWATITRALARFAWKVATKGGANQRAAVKSSLDSGIMDDGPYNPAPSAGSTWIESEASVNLQPVKTAGATTSPQDGRRLLLMVCAAMGFPETFFGDAEVGTLATARSLDRPTELAMLGRQRLWTEILENVIGYAIEQKARKGTVPGFSGEEITDDWDEQKWIYSTDPATGEPFDVHVSITWPSVVERNMAEYVDAIVKAATLGGTMGLAGTLSAEYTTQQLLVALGEKSVEEVMKEWFPEGQPAEPLPQAEALRHEMKEFLTLLKEARIAE